MSNKDDMRERQHSNQPGPVKRISMVGLVFADPYDKIALTLLACTIGLWGWLLTIKFFALRYYDWDLALYAQAMWDLCRGKFYSSLFDMNFLVNHVEYISFFVLPVYALFQHPLTLIYLKILSYATGAYVLYRIAKRDLSPLLSLIWMLLYLLFPANIYTILYEFHMESLNIVFLFLLFYFFSGGRLVPFYVTAVLTCLIKENMPPIIVMYGLLALFTKKDKVRWGAIPIAFGLIYFYLTLFVVTPALRASQGISGAHTYLYLYSGFGQTPLEMIKTVFIHPEKILKIVFAESRLSYLNEFLSPLAYLPVFSPHILFLGLPVIGQQLLSSAFQSQTIFFHYGATLTPFFFLAALETLKWTKRKAKSSFVYAIFIAVLLCSGVNLAHYSQSIRQKIQNFYNFMIRPQWDMIRQIPEQSGVIATLSFLSSLSQRESLYSFLDVTNGRRAFSHRIPELDPQVKFALLNFADGWIQDIVVYYRDLESVKRMQKFLADGWIIKDIAGDNVLLERSKHGDFFLVERSSQPFDIKVQPEMSLAEAVKLLGVEIDHAPAVGGQNVLPMTFYWKAESPLSSVLGMELILAGEGGNTLVSRRMIGYPFMPTIAWQPGDFIKEHYYFYLDNLPEGVYELQARFYRKTILENLVIDCSTINGRIPCRDGYIGLGRIVVPVRKALEHSKAIIP